MKAVKKFWRKLFRLGSDDRGSALVIVTLLLALLTIYVSASLTIATTDVVSSNFEVAQQRGFYAAYSKLEQMSRDFSSLFITSLAPSYDSMCRIVVSDNPSIAAAGGVINGFRIAKPNVNCPSGSNCVPSYVTKSVGTTDLFDLGWVGSPAAFCMIDVCNPSIAPVCNFPLRPPNQIQVQKGDFAGLQGFARRYREVSTVVSENRGGADVQITRDFDNILLPLFQFGIFTDSDFELYDPPNWAFGGWVHTNGDFYYTGQTTPGAPRATFSQYVLNGAGGLQQNAARITVGRHILIGDKKTATTASRTDSYMYVYNDNAGNFDNLNLGSARTGAQVANCNGVTTFSTDVLAGVCGPISGTPSGTVKIGVRPLKLPIQNILGANPIQLIKRGLASDFDPNRGSPYVNARYYYKPGIRITMTDYQNQLPRDVLPGDNPSHGNGPYGGIQLDAPDNWLADNVNGPGGALSTQSTGGVVDWYYQAYAPAAGISPKPIPRGYQPKVADPVNGKPTGARVNGNRIHGWIKVELVRLINLNIQTFDITQEILNLGVTVPYTANTASAFYYPRTAVGFPVSVPVPAGSNGPYPDENSIIHLQRFGVPYTTTNPNGALPALTSSGALNPGLERVDGPTGVRFDYYASMALRAYDGNLNIFGIEDTGQPNAGPNPLPNNIKFTTRLDGTGPAGQATYSEPQPDPGGYYTDLTHAPVPTNNPTASRIDFVNGNTATRNGSIATYLSENVNLPKRRINTAITSASNALTDQNSVLYVEGETTWTIAGLATPPINLNNLATPSKHLIPFPINIFDSREGTPHEPNAGEPTDPPVPGLGSIQVSKVGVMNLVELDMGNVGRMLRGDFNNLFASMGNTAYRARVGAPLDHLAMRDNIDVNQDNGWLMYISDRRGDEPVTNANPNVKLPATQPAPPAALPAPNAALDNSIIGDGEYNREDVVWTPGGDTNNAGGASGAINVKFGGSSGCVAGTLLTDNKDDGKSPQDANNDCFIATEGANGYSETAAYSTGLVDDQTAGLTFADATAGTTRLGNIIAMSQVPTTTKQPWSRKPPVAFPIAGGARVELFRRGVRLVNGSSLFPLVNGNGPVLSPSCNAFLGITVTAENPVYVFGTYNTPAAEVGDRNDQYPGLRITPVTISPPRPTSPGDYNGQDPATCNGNCHVPAAVVADAITLLSSACVGTANAPWTNYAGWMDARSFVSPYQSISNRSARNTVYRFALISGFTPSWYQGFWGQAGTNQGDDSQYSSGALNNFPRFLEDWGQAGGALQSLTYAGSLIRIFKSVQGNGAFKRLSGSSAVGTTDYVYRPPSRDWVFDTDFTDPCTLPPGSPFLQLIDFKGFQQTAVQR